MTPFSLLSTVERVNRTQIERSKFRDNSGSPRMGFGCRYTRSTPKRWSTLLCSRRDLVESGCGPFQRNWSTPQTAADRFVVLPTYSQLNGLLGSEASDSRAARSFFVVFQNVHTDRARRRFCKVPCPRGADGRATSKPTVLKLTSRTNRHYSRWTAKKQRRFRTRRNRPAGFRS
jgi:hypothetical protein